MDKELYALIPLRLILNRAKVPYINNIGALVFFVSAHVQVVAGPIVEGVVQLNAGRILHML